MLRAHLHRTRRGATEEQRRIGLLEGPGLGEHVLEAVELALEVERLGRGPDLAHHVEILGGAHIALFLGREVALALLVGIAVANDDVQRQTAAGELVERRRGARRDGRRHDARAMGDQEGQRPGLAGRVARDVEALGRRRVVADERVVEARGFVGLREFAEEGRRDAPGDHMQRSPLWRGHPDHSDHFDGHASSGNSIYWNTVP